MAGLNEIKERITSVQSTQQITKAMKMVAAAKLRRAQDKITNMRPYASKLNDILANVSATLDADVASVYSQERDVEKVAVIVVTSDRGLCGGFNANIMKGVNALLNGKYAKQLAEGNLSLVCIGKKGADFFKKNSQGAIVVDQFSTLFSDLSFENAKVAIESLMEDFVAEKFDAVEVVYNSFQNVVTQVVTTEQLLPLVAEEEENVEADSNIEYIFEPSEEVIVNELIPKSIKLQFYKSLLDSNASEHGARMTAMDNATENAGELLKELQLTYNRGRQAAITKEILEIVGGAEALKNG